MDSHSATIVGKENVDSGKFVILAKSGRSICSYKESGADNEKDLF
jgi:hypothetical protein